MEAPRVTEEPFIIRSLEASDAVALAALLQSQSPEYARFFRPFDFDETTLRRLLCNLK